MESTGWRSYTASRSSVPSVSTFIHGITFKSLSSNLKILEEDGLVLRKDYGENPPRVEYSLSELGTTLIPILDAMCIWGEEHMDQKMATSDE